MRGKVERENFYLLNDGTPFSIPSEYWSNLMKRDVNELSRLTLFDIFSSNGLVFHFLHKKIKIDIKKRELEIFNKKSWEKSSDPLLELIVLLYLNNATFFYPIGKDIASVSQLSEAHFFKGYHKLKTDPLIKQFENDIEGFKKSAKCLDGQSVNFADAAYRFLPFPKVPLYYLFWKGDKKFAPNITVLFEKSIKKVLPASWIWGFVNLVSSELKFN